MNPTEKMTVAVVAVLHGDDKPLAANETWEAGTKQELARRFVKFLRDVADDVERELGE